MTMCTDDVASKPASSATTSATTPTSPVIPHAASTTRGERGGEHHRAERKSAPFLDVRLRTGCGASRYALPVAELDDSGIDSSSFFDLLDMLRSLLARALQFRILQRREEPLLYLLERHAQLKTAIDVLRRHDLGSRRNAYPWLVGHIARTPPCRCFDAM